MTWSIVGNTGAVAAGYDFRGRATVFMLERRYRTARRCATTLLKIRADLPSAAVSPG